MYDKNISYPKHNAHTYKTRYRGGTYKKFNACKGAYTSQSA